MKRLEVNKRGDGNCIFQQQRKVSRIRIVQIAIKETANNVEHWMAEAYPVTHFPTKYTDTSGFNVFGTGDVESIDWELVRKFVGLP